MVPTSAPRGPSWALRALVGLLALGGGHVVAKIGAGPVMPSAASVAANTPLRAAFANAHPVHMLNSPDRVCRRAVLHTPAIPTAWVVRVTSRFISFADATAEEIAP